MSEMPPEKIFDLQAEFPDVDFDTIDPNTEGEDFHFRIASRFADAWNLKGELSDLSDQMGVSPSAENILRKIDMTVIDVLNAADYPIAFDAHLNDVRRFLHKELSCYVIKKKRCYLDRTPGKKLEILLLSYSALNLTERARICIEKNDMGGIVIYTLSVAEGLIKLIDHYGRHLFGKIRGKSIAKKAKELHELIIKADQELRKNRPRMAVRSRAIAIGRKLSIPTETVRTHLKKEHRVG